MDEKTQKQQKTQKSDQLWISEILKSAKFPRSDRFVLASKKNPEIQNFVRHVEINHLLKTLTVDVFELMNNDEIYPHDWLNKSVYNESHVDDMTLFTFDGCGDILYTIDFLEVKTFDISTKFSYDDSGIVTHRVQMTFSKMTKPNLSRKSLDGF